MDRIAAAAILVILLGIWVHPFISGANSAATATPATSTFTSTLESGPTTNPTTQPVESRFDRVVGQSGFWRLAKTRDGVWWFLSPADETEFLNTVTTAQPYQLGRDSD